MLTSAEPLRAERAPVEYAGPGRTDRPARTRPSVGRAVQGVQEQ